MLLEAVRTRLLYRSLDALVTAPLRTQRPFSENLRSVLSPRSSNYDRVGSSVALLDAVLPGAARRASRLTCRFDGLPLRSERIRLIGYGSGATVFLVEEGRRRYVLKVYRKTLGASPGHLPALAGTYRRRYELFRTWYGGMPELVWPAQYLVMRGPIRRRPAVACLQAFIEEETADLLNGFGADALGALLEGSERLRRQFLYLARRTLDVCRSQRLCPDFLGEKNLSIVGSGLRRRLCFIDYGVFDLAAGDRRSVAARDRLESSIERIRSLAEQLA